MVLSNCIPDISKICNAPTKIVNKYEYTFPQYLGKLKIKQKIEKIDKTKTRFLKR